MGIAICQIPGCNFRFETKYNREWNYFSMHLTNVHGRMPIKEYYVDFKIKIGNKFRLVEIKGKGPWYYKDRKEGVFQAKVKAAVEYSRKNKYLPFKVIFDDRKQNKK